MKRTVAATRRWCRSPNDELAVRNGCYFDTAAAERVRVFFRAFLRIPPPQSVVADAVAEGRPPPPPIPFELIDWQWEDVIAPLFGWKRPDGTRRFRRGYISVAKKNGKTELVSAVTLYLLVADGEEDAEVYSVAGSLPQAGLVYQAASKMVKRSREVAKIVKAYDSAKRIVAPRNSFYRSLSSEHATAEGINAHGTIYDELHVAKSPELFNALEYAGSARLQPLSLVITTAGDGSDPGHVCRQQYDYARGVERGEIDDTEFLTYIAEAKEGCELDDPKAWRDANPSLGITISEDSMAAAAAAAMSSPAKESSFRRYKLNQWVSSADSWLSDTLLDKLPSDLDESSLAGRQCYGGLDLSATDDLTAAAFVFPPLEEGGPIDVVVRPYLPGDNLQALEQRHKQPLAAWARSGHLNTTDGNVVDYDAVTRDIAAFATSHHVLKLGLDRGFQGQAVEQTLQDLGVDVVPVGAGWRSQSQPLKDLEKWIKAGRLQHAGNPLFRWNMLSAVIKIDDAGNYSLTKRLSRSKVDIVAAVVNAVACWLFLGNGEPANFYESDPELITLDL